jgi:1-deoxy-D-xylulose-5-phosphate synthase
MTAKAVEISKELEKESINCEIINTRFLKPIDTKTLLNSIKKTKKVIVLEDASILNGLSTTIKELLIDNKINDVYCHCFAYPDEFIKHGSIKELNKQYKVDVESIIKDIKR